MSLDVKCDEARLTGNVIANMSLLQRKYRAHLVSLAGAVVPSSAAVNGIESSNAEMNPCSFVTSCSLACRYQLGLLGDGGGSVVLVDGGRAVKDQEEAGQIHQHPW